MAFERKTTQYQPDLPPPSIEGAQYIQSELQRIANVLELFAQGQMFEVSYAEPERPRTGMLRLADGTEWNPGSGRGLYWYDEDTASWKFIS